MTIKTPSSPKYSRIENAKIQNNKLNFTFTCPAVRSDDKAWFELYDQSGVAIPGTRGTKLLEGVSATCTIDTGKISISQPWTLVAGLHIKIKEKDTIAATCTIDGLSGTDYVSSTVSAPTLSLTSATVSYTVPADIKLTGLERQRAFIIVTAIGKTFQGADPSKSNDEAGMFGFKELIPGVNKYLGQVSVDVTGITDQASYQVGLYLGDGYRLCAFDTTIALR